MRRSPHDNASRPAPCLAFLVLCAVTWCWPGIAFATFHLNEINKVMVSHDGDVAVQAVELNMINSGENLVNGASIVVYDGNGNVVATLGTFGADLPAPGAVVGAKILCATMKWKQRFGVTPDLQISPGLLQQSGQIAFQKPTCTVSAIAYGNCPVLIGGNVGAAPPMPSLGAPVLVRIQDNAVFPACPMGDDAANRFRLATAANSSTITFTNYSGVSASVGSTVTGVETTPAAPPAPRAYPNPFHGSVRVEGPAFAPVAIYDVRGSLVAVLASRGSVGTTAFRGEWNGRDLRGRPAAAGVYFIRFGSGPSAPVQRIALLR